MNRSPDREIRANGHLSTLHGEINAPWPMPFFAYPSGRAEPVDCRVIATCFDGRMERPLVGSKGSPVLDWQVAGLQALGRQLRRARLARGWAQRELERRSGVDQTTISRLENGRLASLRLLKIAALIHALGSTFEIDVL